MCVEVCVGGGGEGGWRGEIQEKTKSSVVRPSLAWVQSLKLLFVYF